MAIVQLEIMSAHPGALLVEEVVHLVEAEEDLAGVADEKDDDDADEHERDAAVPTTPASSNAYSCHGGTYSLLLIQR